MRGRSMQAETGSSGSTADDCVNEREPRHSSHSGQQGGCSCEGRLTPEGSMRVSVQRYVQRDGHCWATGQTC
jgi:hypothetical protein